METLVLTVVSYQILKKLYGFDFISSITDITPKLIKYDDKGKVILEKDFTDFINHRFDYFVPINDSTFYIIGVPYSINNRFIVYNFNFNNEKIEILNKNKFDCQDIFVSNYIKSEDTIILLIHKDYTNNDDYIIAKIDMNGKVFYQKQISDKYIKNFFISNNNLLFFSTDDKTKSVKIYKTDMSGNLKKEYTINVKTEWSHPEFGIDDVLQLNENEFIMSYPVVFGGILRLKIQRIKID